MLKRLLISALVVVVAIVAAGAMIIASPDASGEVQATKPPHTTLAATEGVLSVEAQGAIGSAQLTYELNQWFKGVAEAAWYAGVQAELDRQAAEAEAARQRAAAASRGPSASYTGVGECTGFAIPDYIIQRESGGNPWVSNSGGSGAFGCAQVMPMHWNGGACSDLDKWTIEGQRECVNRLSSGGTNLNPWAQTR